MDTLRVTGVVFLSDSLTQIYLSHLGTYWVYKNSVFQMEKVLNLAINSLNSIKLC